MDSGVWWATVRGVTESDTTEQLHIHMPIIGRTDAKAEAPLIWPPDGKR